MSVGSMKIDRSSVLDNIDARQLEFTAEVDAEDREFAVLYDLLEALSGDVPDGDAEETFDRFEDEIVDAALSALVRNSDASPVVVSENDLDQSA